MTISPLVSTEWLAEHIADSSILIVDIRSAESGGQAAFEAGHVPRAVHSDYATDGWRITEGGAGGLLPNVGHLSALLSRIGTTPEHHVVIVPAGEAASDFSALHGSIGPSGLPGMDVWRCSMAAIDLGEKPANPRKRDCHAQR
ncbi:rhodanese-like domain-containing protein [Microvirga vignae]|uniref:rhodanese-like domain-containing protein n=1 Tax=Microvirga vignae TaxID=1225564 RepID=UPI00069C7707|nr:rhodanese-like domain-containing protein [Microvirga vignae]